MKKLTSQEIRKMFLTFFEAKEHQILTSASLIPVNDPSLLWINSGVATLKPYFAGQKMSPSKRMVSSQKCIRTNDIDNVGETAIHHTFFEMLGNFSIGDYFKKEAIEYAYEFLTSNKYLGLDKEKLYITVYPTDIETYNLWLALGIDESHLIKLANNYWEIGEGPSGPDTEIFYDRGIEYDPDQRGLELLTKEIDNDRYVEIWNIVFSQFDAKEGLTREEYPELPNKNIDTGMGLERICCIMQDGKTNYDTDLFLPIIKEIEVISKKKYYGDKPFKVIADHIRALVFALADGASFANEGRGYVLRRLLRRAVRYGRKLGIKDPFLAQLVNVVVSIMQDYYPYLEAKTNTLFDLILTEEKLFFLTLDSGEKRLRNLFKHSTDGKITGAEAFKLYDTYGFPFELTLEYAQEAGFTVAKEEFEEYMDQQRKRARAACHFKVEGKDNSELLEFKEKSTFVGYDYMTTTSKVIGLLKDGKLVSYLDADGVVILDNTPFYAEAGGQLSDTGYIISDNSKAQVVNVTKAPHLQHLHAVKLTTGIINVGDKVKAEIDIERRKRIARNHSAVHILHNVLNSVLTNEVSHAGASVEDTGFRFDITYFGKISDDDILKVENMFNQKIKLNHPTQTELMPLAEAKAKKAMALFDDKYGDMVRVVTLLDSVELCGGTHVNNVLDIERLAIVGFEPRGTNVYRILGATGDNIKSQLQKAIQPYQLEMNKLLTKAEDILAKAKDEGIDLAFDFELPPIPLTSYQGVISYRKEMDRLRDKLKTLGKEYQKQTQQKMLSNVNALTELIEKLNNKKVIIAKVEGYDTKGLKQLLSDLLDKHELDFIFLANINNNSVNFLAKKRNNAHNNINCGAIVKEASIKAGGSGGGNNLLAQGGGRLISAVDEIVKNVKWLVMKKD